MKVTDVISFWFEELSPQQWYQSNLDLDEEIRKRFLKTHQRAVQGELYFWRKSPEGRLAEIIILDQFSRNIYRDKPLAFAADSMTLALSQEAINLELDLSLDINKRIFMYMPFMHSESLEIHDVAVELFSTEGMSQSLEYELQHQRIIKKFKRYPHRNHILNCDSTEEELEFLKKPNSSF